MKRLLSTDSFGAQVAEYGEARAAAAAREASVTQLLERVAEVEAALQEFKKREA